MIRDSSGSKEDPGCVFERETEISLCIRVGRLEMQSIVLSKKSSLLILFPPYFLLLQSPTPTDASICKIQSMSIWPVVIKADHAGGGCYWGIRQGHEMALQAGEHAH